MSGTHKIKSKERKGSLAGEPGLGDLVTTQGSSTLALT